MSLLFLLRTVGFLLAHTPEFALRALAAGLGDMIFFCFRGRRRLALSNLSHAFPEKPAAWRRAIARESCRRLVETGLLSLALPSLPPRRLRRILRLAPAAGAFFQSYRGQPRPVLMCLPHMAYWEALTVLPLLLETPSPEFGVIFRPLDNPAADAWMRRTRERFGMKLLSRKEGFQEALRLLRRRGIAALLFDQNAGRAGALTTLFGRICSTTELPSLLAGRPGAEVYGVYSRRLGFWRAEFVVETISPPEAAASATLALNRWLEALLRREDNLCASWLWLHDRWRHQDSPDRRLRLEAKRDLLATDLAARGLSAPPRRTRVWVRLPNWLGDVVIALPLLRALRVSRPDAELTLVGRASFRPLAEAFGVADCFETLPPRGVSYFLHFWRRRHRYPDCFLLFTNSLRGDLEAWLTRCPQRFGLVRRNRPRPLLTHAWRVPADFDERTQHELALWENFLRRFGLNAPPDLTPLPRLPTVALAEAGGPGVPPGDLPKTEPRPPPSTLAPRPSPLDSCPSTLDPRPSTFFLGLIAGSENSPAKRWPVAHWRALATQLLAAHPEAHLRLFGTAGDLPVATAVADGFDPARVQNLAGRTDLSGFMARLRECRLLVTNDTGGMHLANALGVPVLALFGPTNPLRTGPVFAAPHRVLQPPGCPATGGGGLGALAPETVLAAARRQLDEATPN